MFSSKKRKLEKLAKATDEYFMSKQVKIDNDGDQKHKKLEEINKDDNEDDEDLDNLNYEDNFDDEYDEEDIINNEEVEEEEDNSNDVDEEELEEGDWEDDNNMNDKEEMKEEIIEPIEKKKKKKKVKFIEEEEAENEDLTKQFENLTFSDVPVIVDDTKNIKKNKKKKDEVKPFLGNNKDLKPDETLEFDNRAYDMFHRTTPEWPCLTCDFLIPEHNISTLTKPIKTPIEKYPVTVYLVAGSQALQKNKNQLYIVKFSDLHKTKYDDDSEIFDEEDSDNDEEPKLDVFSIKQSFAINKVRSMNGTGIVAVYNENSDVTLYDCREHLQALHEHIDIEEEDVKSNGLKAPVDPKNQNFALRSFKLSAEGFALEWSPLRKGVFATGSTDKKMFLYHPIDENCSDWTKDNHPYMIHTASIEDIQFSPTNENYIASCSVDGTIRITDLRTQIKSKAEQVIKAADCDVNVISWNHSSIDLIASGADDGSIKIWDLRYVKAGEPISEIQWHTDQITSIQFQPFEESVVAVASADNRLSIWDFSVEPEKMKKEEDELPDQMIFLHQGQEEIKEIRHHPYMSDVIVSTAGSGFNIFKPNYDEQDEEEDDS